MQFCAVKVDMFEGGLEGKFARPRGQASKALSGRASSTRGKLTSRVGRSAIATIPEMQEYDSEAKVKNECGLAAWCKRQGFFFFFYPASSLKEECWKPRFGVCAGLRVKEALLLTPDTFLELCLADILTGFC